MNLRHCHHIYTNRPFGRQRRGVRRHAISRELRPPRETAKRDAKLPHIARHFAYFFIAATRLVVVGSATDPRADSDPPQSADPSTGK